MTAGLSYAQLSEPREWSDATGGHKITATFMEVKDGNVFLKSPLGKTIKIPLARLSPADQELVKGTSDERKGFETADQIQLWRISGKKVIQSKTWVPFPDEAESWGKKTNGALVYAVAIPNNKLVLLTSNGHLACIDVVTRKPFWHAKLSDQFAVDASVDRSLLAVADGPSIMIVDPQTGTVKSSVIVEDKPHIGWPRLRWSPSGTKLLFTFISSMRVLDLANGTWTNKCEFTGGPIAAYGLSYPHDDYALLDDHLLVHIPSQIKVCEYRDATRITTVGGMSFIGMQNGDAGLVVPAKIPHPAAEKILAQAQKDPSVFLIHSGVQVSIDAAGAGQWAGQALQMLSKAATASG